MPSTGRGRLALVGGADVFDVDLELWPDVPGAPVRLVAGDYFWGTGTTEAFAPVEIPYAWVSPPVARRPTTVINSATVNQVDGATAHARGDASIARYGIGAGEVTLDTDCDADPAALATFLVAYYGQPRPRQPVLVLNLYNRTDAECLRILRVKLGQRVLLTGTPTGWPPGAAAFVVEGIHHAGAVDERTVTWSTSAIVGTTASQPGPWFRWDASQWDGTDLRPF
jgi:hypothetical protein